MIRRLIILLLIVGCVFAREYIAIIDFEGISVSEADAKALTQRLTSEMITLELYQVLERSEMKRLLDEQKFQYSGCVDLKCAVELGKMLGAKYMVVGSVSKVGSSYSIDSRMIDVETSEAYISANFTHKGEIDILLTSGIVSIAKQLCELEGNPNYESLNSNQQITSNKVIDNNKPESNQQITSNKVIDNNKPELKFIPYDKAPKPKVPIRPIYSEIAQEAGIEGTVYIQFFIDARGNVTEAWVLKGIPNTGLDEAALEAVKKSKWKPAQQRKKKVGVWQTVPVKFELY